MSPATTRPKALRRDNKRYFGYNRTAKIHCCRILDIIGLQRYIVADKTTNIP